MYRLWKTSAIALLVLLTLATAASAQRRTTVSHSPPPVVVVERPVFWDPFWYDPYYPWGPPAYAYSGEVKLKTERKDASVYVDHGYAGKAGKLKKFSLPPGTHDIELRDNEGQTFFHKKVQVIAGKTLKLEADYRG
jgi:PEGA domain-containing protein